MTALSASTDLLISGGILTPMPLEASANPYQGSLLSRAADGYVHELVAGEPFVGVARRTIPSADAAAADGGNVVEAVSGIMYAEVPLTSVAIDDAAHCRKVYATDDATFAFSGSTLVGVVVGVAASNRAKVILVTADMQHLLGGPISGVKTLEATGAQTLTTADLGKLILCPNTAAYTVTLPGAADSAGRMLQFKKTTSDAVTVTLDGAGAETIDGATTSTVLDGQYDTITIVSDGTSWHIVELAYNLDNSVRTVGAKTMHATTASQALATTDLGKLILIPNTGAITITLPAAASCTNRGYIFKKTSADAEIVTIDADGAETIDGATTAAVIDAANDMLEIVSNGTAWYIIGSKIA